jgi:N-acetylglucosaminyldiphosphoundecaprenol N-acetyl-beta-D-mannosaminyltransferase
MVEIIPKMHPRVNILGVGVHPMKMQDALDFIQQRIVSRDPAYICLTPIHAIMECYDRPELRRIYNHSGLTTPDGMGVVWLLKMGGYRAVQRVYGPDLLLKTCEMSQQKGYRHFFYGGAPGVVDSLTTRLCAQFPDLQVCGSYSPPFRELTELEDLEIIQRIQEAKPDILWVGIGSPRQEIWMSQHLARLSVPILAGVGAAFDFHSGNKPQAPKWIQRSGLEWLYRFFSEPRRLFRRYIINYPRFALLTVAQAVGILKIPLE